MSNVYPHQMVETIIGEIGNAVSGPILSSWVDMSYARNPVFRAVTGLGTAGDDPAISLEQATDSSGTGAKNLNIANIFIRNMGTGHHIQHTPYTEVAYNGDNYVNADSAENYFEWVVPVQYSDLDQANGFKFVRMSIGDVAQSLLCYMECQFVPIHSR